MKINESFSIQKKLSEEFDAVIGFVEQEEDGEVTSIGTKEVYTPKDLDSDSKIGQSIVTNAKFITELVKIYFSKKDAELIHPV